MSRWVEAVNSNRLSQKRNHRHRHHSTTPLFSPDANLHHTASGGPNRRGMSPVDFSFDFRWWGRHNCFGSCGVLRRVAPACQASSAAKWDGGGVARDADAGMISRRNLAISKIKRLRIRPRRRLPSSWSTSRYSLANRHFYVMILVFIEAFSGADANHFCPPFFPPIVPSSRKLPDLCHEKAFC
jgi:hypothetical protein